MLAGTQAIEKDVLECYLSSYDSQKQQGVGRHEHTAVRNDVGSTSAVIKRVEKILTCENNADVSPQEYPCPKK